MGSHRPQRNLLIPLGGGASVAADLYLPDGLDRAPAVVSYYPYRKDDVIGAYVGPAVEHFARRGYASLLIDFRGLGNSSGVAWDAFDAAEAQDGAEIVEWIAEQPWCDGNVGMWGISYGGTTSFQTAAARPPHLRAIVSIMGGLDLYRDYFYPGGCFNCLGASIWGASMFALQLMPPMYQDPDGRWYDVWLERLEGSEPCLLPWREHRARDAFWQTKEIDASKIEVPTFLIGGWRDLFPEIMVRAYEQIGAPRKLLMGPWLHGLPDLDDHVPIDYLAEMCRWWDRWLKGTDTSITEEPPVTIYVQGQDIWRHEQEWPIARAQERELFLRSPGRLEEHAATADAYSSYSADPTVGTAAGLWDPMSIGTGLPLDQAEDDLHSLTFTSDPLAEPVEITGSPMARVHAALEEGNDLHLVVKLCDVSPDGQSSLITTGWLNGAHRLSHEEPIAMPIGELSEFVVQLWATSYEVPAGHRLRVSVAAGDFPRIWPARTNGRIRLSLGGVHASSIHLPVVPTGMAQSLAVGAPDFSANPLPLVLDFEPRWRIERDLVRNTTTVTMGLRWISMTPSGDGRLEMDQTASAIVARDRPDGARVEEETTVHLQTPSGNRVRVETRSRHTLAGFALSGTVLVDGQPFFEREWHG